MECTDDECLTALNTFESQACPRNQIYLMFDVYRQEIKKLKTYFDTIHHDREKVNNLLDNIGDFYRLKYINSRRYWSVLASLDISEKDVHAVEYHVQKVVLKGDTNVHKIELITSFVIEKMIDKLDMEDDPRVAPFRLNSEVSKKVKTKGTVKRFKLSQGLNFHKFIRGSRYA